MIRSTLDLFAQFPQSIAAGLLTAAVCSLLGVFVVLKRMVFIGATLSETAACGIALSFLLHWPPLAGAALLTLGVVSVAAYPYESARVPRDAVLGLLFVAAAAGGILIVSKSGFGLMEIKALLYGDLILADAADLRMLVVVLVPVAAGLLLFLRPILNSFLDREAARVMGLRPALWEGVFFVGLGLAVSAASKITGPLLVFCYLLAPPATALILTRRFGVAMALSAGVGLAATAVGIAISFALDLPTNQTICVVCVVLPGLAALVRALVRRG